MKNYKIEIKWSFIFIGSLLLWMFLERLFGLHDEHIDKHQYLTMVFSIIAIVLYVFALRDKRKYFYEGNMTYKQGLMAGIAITVVVTVFSPLTQWIISNLITPLYFENVIAHSVDQGYYQTVEEAAAHFNLKNYIIQSTIGAFVMGLITSLIVAFFTKSK